MQTENDLTLPVLDAKAEQIIRAAREIFLEIGYSASSMDLVAQRARVSKTTLYTRFPSKAELYTAMIFFECDLHGMRFHPEDFADLSLRETLLRVGQRFVDLIWSEAAVRLYQSVHGEASRMPEVAKLFYEAGPEKARAAVVALFGRLAERGLIATDDPAFAATQFLSAMQGGPHCALVIGMHPQPTAEERNLFVVKAVDLFIRGIAPG